MTTSGSTDWSFTVDLARYGGKNRILVNAMGANGKLAAREIVVDYRPAAKVSVVNGASGISQNSSSIQKWEKLEATFNIKNSIASTPGLSYETNLPAGMPKGTGITVDGVFTSPSGKSYRQPGFRCPAYTRNTSTRQLLPTGDQEPIR